MNRSTTLLSTWRSETRCSRLAMMVMLILQQKQQQQRPGKQQHEPGVLQQWLPRWHQRHAHAAASLSLVLVRQGWLLRLCSRYVQQQGD